MTTSTQVPGNGHFDALHAMVVRSVRAREQQLGWRVASGRLLSELPAYARRVAETVLVGGEPCDHLKAAAREGAPETAFAFSDEHDVILCGGCMRLRAQARVGSSNDGSACDVCGGLGSTYVVVAGVAVITGSLCESCGTLWDVPVQRGAVD